MKNNDYDKFVDLMKKLSINFKGDINTSKIVFYFNELKKYKINAVERGINHLINIRVYPSFPIVGEIVTAIKDTSNRIIL